MSIIHNFEDDERKKLKVTPMKPLERNLNSALSTTLNNFVYLEDVGNYPLEVSLRTRIWNFLFNHDMNVKPRFENLKDFDLFKYHFYCELDTEQWT